MLLFLGFSLISSGFCFYLPCYSQPRSICYYDPSSFESTFFVEFCDILLYCFFFFPYSCTFPAKATLLVSLYIFSLNICFCSSKIRGNLFFINLKFLCPAIEICTCCLIGISVLTFSKYLKFSMYKTGLTKLPTAYSTSVNGEYTSQHLTSCFSERPRCEFCLILMCN